MNKYLFLIFTAVLLLVIINCAPRQKTLVVVVPEKNGKVGAVTVTTPSGETRINTAYAAVRTEKGGRTETIQLSEQDVKTIFNAALNVRPDPPLFFTLYFLEGKDELTRESKQRLPDVLAEISRRGGNISEVTVVGHTDSVGKMDYNDGLSLQRALRVVDELVKIGIESGAISAAGRGDRDPMVPTEDQVSEPRNRRVEVIIR